jgi:hypothetical protein
MARLGARGFDGLTPEFASVMPLLDGHWDTLDGAGSARWCDQASDEPIACRIPIDSESFQQDDIRVALNDRSRSRLLAYTAPVRYCRISFRFRGRGRALQLLTHREVITAFDFFTVPAVQIASNMHSPDERR